MTKEEAKKMGATHTDSSGLFYKCDGWFTFVLAGFEWSILDMSTDMTKHTTLGEQNDQR